MFAKLIVPLTVIAVLSSGGKVFAQNRMARPVTPFQPLPFKPVPFKPLPFKPLPFKPLPFNTRPLFKPQPFFLNKPIILPQITGYRPQPFIRPAFFPPLYFPPKQTFGYVPFPGYSTWPFPWFGW